MVGGRRHHQLIAILERLMTPEQFAQLLIDDLFPNSSTTSYAVMNALVSQIAQSIRQQCLSWQQAAQDDTDDLMVAAPAATTTADATTNDGDDAKKPDLHAILNTRGAPPPSPAMLVAQSPVTRASYTQLPQVASPVGDELDWRTTVRLDLQVGETHLTDQFEWPLTPQKISDSADGDGGIPVLTPELFAKRLCAELGLGGEFVSMIAHSIREQVYYARLNFDEAPKISGLSMPPFRSGDAAASEFAPKFELLDEETIEARLREQERTSRRARRSQRAGAAAATIIISRQLEDEQDALQQSSGSGGRFARATRGSMGGRVPPLPYGRPMVAAQNGAPRPAAAAFSSFSAVPAGFGSFYDQFIHPISAQQQQQLLQQARRHQEPKKVPYKRARATVDEEEVLKKLEETVNMPLAKLAPPKEPPKTHRGFGASAQRFNQDGSMHVGEFRLKWRCAWCLLSGKYTPTLRRGPQGTKTLCNACGIWYAKHGNLPQERYQEHAGEDGLKKST